MFTPDELYPLIASLLQAGQLVRHATARTHVARLLATLLIAQDLRPSALIRILPAHYAHAARQRYAHVRRALRRTGLTSGALTPFLIRATLAWVRGRGLAPDGAKPWLVALDSVRCGRWEIFTIGLDLPGRAMPLAWAVLPYPWPRGQFRSTVDGLVERLLRGWPGDEPVCLLADRAFPAKSFFRTLAQGGAEYTVRLQARHAVTLANGQCRRIGLLLDAADPTKVTWQPVTFGAGADAVSGYLVIAGRALTTIPAHQTGPASRAARVRRGTRRRKQQAHKRAGTNQGARRDEWIVLFTTRLDPVEALDQYSRRWAIEGTYRDLQGGWDGMHGWQADRVIVRCTEASEVDALMGFWALGTLVQIGLGVGVTAETAPAAVRAAPRSWATTPRLSWWWRGRCALQSPDLAIRQWIPQELQAIVAILEAAPAAVIPFDPTPSDGADEAAAASTPPMAKAA
jgi:hypothetical protein